MSAPDRAAYAARQAQLLDALLRGDDYPAGFVAEQADAAGHSLRRKRARAVAHAWPALVLALGDTFGDRFDTFARVADALQAGDPLADGLEFALSLESRSLTDDARAELLFARAGVRRARDGSRRARRTPFIGLARLHAPRSRVLVVVRLPWLGRRHLAVGLPSATWTSTQSRLADPPRQRRGGVLDHR